jgi:quercetin dioxygenase-like cupin family protein
LKPSLLQPRLSGVVGLAVGLCVMAPPVARANARAETEEARIADILQATLVKHGAEVNRCFEKALADTLDVAGKIELSVDVGAGGKVTKASPARDDVKSPVLVACLTESAATWSLAGIDPGSTVIVPLAFEGQANQFSIKVKDAPDHGPPAPKKKAGTPGNAPPFSVKLLVDEATMRAQKASLMQLSIAPANRIAMHQHPGAEILYVLRGHARILGRGTPPQKLDEGMAIFIPPNTPHAIENMGRQSSAVLLDVFAPMGPERVYRDPTDAAGRAAFQVVRDAGNAAGGSPEAKPMSVASSTSATAIALPGGKARVRMLLQPKDTAHANAYLGLLEADPGAEIPRHSHPGAAEILYVVSGSGEVTIGSEKIAFGPEEAIHIPEGQPHAGKFTGAEKTVMVQIYAPAGPEERFRTPAAAPAKGK